MAKGHVRGQKFRDTDPSNVRLYSEPAMRQSTASFDSAIRFVAEWARKTCTREVGLAFLMDVKKSVTGRLRREV